MKFVKSTMALAVAAVALGIAVDDTIHFLQHYKKRRDEHGSAQRALEETFALKGPGMVATSVVISLGFSAMLSASFAPTRTFGLLTAGAMLAALFGDLVILPATLAVVHRGRRSSSAAAAHGAIAES